MRVLVYGDSNSWGYLADGLGHRLEARWPVVMAEVTGWTVIEDCLPGRTTVHDDPEMAEAEPAGAAWNGLAHLEAAMLSASPLDLVVIMLGTNDLKARFEPSVEKIANNIMALADRAGRVLAGPGSWHDETSPRVAVVSPAPLGALADDPDWDRGPEWAGARAISLKLFARLQNLANGVPVFDAGSIAQGSDRDPVHFEADQHGKLGRGIGAWLLSTFGQGQ